MQTTAGPIAGRPLSSLSYAARRFAVGRVSSTRVRTVVLPAVPAGRATAVVAGPWRQPVTGIAAGSWTTPDLPLYGNDHDRSDFAP